MLNKVILMGRLTADPEVRQTPNGISVLSFSIAVDRNYSKAEKKTDFINLVAWRQTAEFIGRFFTKGQMIAVEGSIQTRNYEDKTGAKRTAFEVVVDQAHFTGGKSENPVRTTQPSYQQPPKFEEPAQNGESFSVGDFNDFDGFEEIGPDDGDLPF